MSISSLAQTTPNIIKEFVGLTNGKIEKTTSLNYLCELFFQTFEFIVQKVESFVIDQPSFKKIVFVFGFSGSGSSSTFSALTQLNQPELIGSSTNPTTTTIIPNCFIKNDIIYIDFPSFRPTQGLTMWMAFETSMQFLFNKYHQKFILLCNIPITESGCCFKYAEDMQSCLKRLFNNCSHHSIIIFTHYENLVHYFIQKMEPTKIKENESRQQEIFKLERLFCKKIGITNFLRFNDLKNQELMQQNFQFITMFPLMSPDSFQPKQYKMESNMQYFFHPKILKLVEETHTNANISLLPNSNILDLIPMIFLDHKISPSIIAFVTHPSFHKSLINIHNEFVHNIQADVGGRISNIPLIAFITSVKLIKSVCQANDQELQRNFDDVDQLCQTSVKNDFHLPLWIKNSLDFTNILADDIKLLESFTDGLTIHTI